MKAGAAQVARVDEDEVVNLLCWVGVGVCVCVCVCVWRGASNDQSKDQ